MFLNNNTIGAIELTFAAIKAFVYKTIQPEGTHNLETIQIELAEEVENIWGQQYSNMNGGQAFDWKSLFNNGGSYQLVPKALAESIEKDRDELQKNAAMYKLSWDNANEELDKVKQLAETDTRIRVDAEKRADELLTERDAAHAEIDQHADLDLSHRNRIGELERGLELVNAQLATADANIKAQEKERDVIIDAAQTLAAELQAKLDALVPSVAEGTLAEQRFKIDKQATYIDKLEAAAGDLQTRLSASDELGRANERSLLVTVAELREDIAAKDAILAEARDLADRGKAALLAYSSENDAKIEDLEAGIGDMQEKLAGCHAEIDRHDASDARSIDDADLLKNNLQAARNDLRSITGKYNARQVEWLAKDQELTAVRGHRDQLQTHVDMRDKDLEQALATIESLNASNDELSHKIDNLPYGSSLVLEIKNLEQALAEKEEQQSFRKQAERLLEQARADHDDKVHTLVLEVNNLNASLSGVNDALVTATKQRDDLRVKLSSTSNGLQKVTKQRDEARIERDEARMERPAAMLTEVRAQRDLFESSLHQAQDDLGECEDKLRVLRVNYDCLQHQTMPIELNKLRKERDSLMEYRDNWSAIQADRDKWQGKVAGMNSKCARLEGQLKAAERVVMASEASDGNTIGDMVMGALGHALSEDEADTSKRIALLLADIKAAESIIQTLRTTVTGLEFNAKADGKMVADLKQSLSDTQVKLDLRIAQVENLDAEMEDMAARVEEMTIAGKRLVDSDNSRRSIQAKYDNLRVVADGYRSDLNKHDDEIISLNDRLSQANFKLSESDDQVCGQAENVLAIKGDRDRLQELVDQQSADLHASDNTRSNLRESVDGLKTKLAAAQDEADAAKHELYNQMTINRTLQSECEGTTRKLREYTDLPTQSVVETRRLVAEVVALRSENADLVSKVAGVGPAVVDIPVVRLQQIVGRTVADLALQSKMAGSGRDMQHYADTRRVRVNHSVRLEPFSVIMASQVIEWQDGTGVVIKVNEKIARLIVPKAWDAPKGCTEPVIGLGEPRSGAPSPVPVCPEKVDIPDTDRAYIPNQDIVYVCNKCGKRNDPQDLVEAKCPACGEAPEQFEPLVVDDSHPEREGVQLWAGDVLIADVVPDQHGTHKMYAQLLAMCYNKLMHNDLRRTLEALIDNYVDCNCQDGHGVCQQACTQSEVVMFLKYCREVQKIGHDGESERYVHVRPGRS